MLEVFEELRSRIGMDANYFYPACVSVISILIPFAVAIFKNIKNGMENKIWDLQCVCKDEYFYGFVFITEIILVAIELIFVKFIGYFLNIIFNLNAHIIIALEICLLIICAAISIKIFLKSIPIRKRVIGSKKKKILICIPVITCYCFMILSILKINLQGLYLIMLIVFFILEVYGLIVFRGYIQYKYASVSLYLNDKTIIEGVDISKIIRRYNCLIINDSRKQVRIKYDTIIRIEYFGGVSVKTMESGR